MHKDPWIPNYGIALRYASKDLQNDREIINEAKKTYGDREIVNEAKKTYGDFAKDIEMERETLKQVAETY